MKFTDDEPVTCDCGCIIYPGESYEERQFTYIKNGCNKRLVIRTCRDTDHIKDALYDAMNGVCRIDEVPVLTADQNEAVYADESEDDYWE